MNKIHRSLSLVLSLSSPKALNAHCGFQSVNQRFLLHDQPSELWNPIWTKETVNLDRHKLFNIKNEQFRGWLLISTIISWQGQIIINTGTKDWWIVVSWLCPNFFWFPLICGFELDLLGILKLFLYTL